MAKENRFIRIYSQGGFANPGMEIWVDRVTGVNYLFTASGYAGGLTVLVDAQGKPIITPPSQLREE